jgi:hypothetical protein
MAPARVARALSVFLLLALVPAGAQEGLAELEHTLVERLAGLVWQRNVGNLKGGEASFRKEVLQIIGDAGKAGEDLNRMDEDGRTPLHWAAANGELAIVQALISHGADKDMGCRFAFQSPLHYASSTHPAPSFSHASCLILPVAARSCRDAAADRMSSPAGSSSLQVAREILSSGADALCRDRFGKTAMHAAVVGNHRFNPLGRAGRAGWAPHSAGSARRSCHPASATLQRVAECVAWRCRGRRDVQDVLIESGLVVE